MGRKYLWEARSLLKFIWHALFLAGRSAWRACRGIRRTLPFSVMLSISVLLFSSMSPPALASSLTFFFLFVISSRLLDWARRFLARLHHERKLYEREDELYSCHEIEENEESVFERAVAESPSAAAFFCGLFGFSFDSALRGQYPLLYGILTTLLAFWVSWLVLRNLFSAAELAIEIKKFGGDVARRRTENILLRAWHAITELISRPFFWSWKLIHSAFWEAKYWVGKASAVLRRNQFLLRESSRFLPQNPAESLIEMSYPNPADVLDPPQGWSADVADREIELLVDRLQEKLSGVGIKGSVDSVVAGPTIITINFRPEKSVKISNVLSLEKDISVALGVEGVRIVAPVPGETFVALELYRGKRSVVRLSSVFPTVEQQISSLGPLPLAIGLSTYGSPILEDLSEMPHLLVAGTTGSGKSVAMHSMIASLILRSRPTELNLLLVDPKGLEFAPYAEFPHLLHDVISETDETIAAIAWLISEMERRYALMKKHGVRRIDELDAELKPPYIVLVIDEYADLLLQGQKKLESRLLRLVQKSRAAGIHVILATQRPSVDIITGVIKANFPARIAFKVASKVDSKVILDATGAEALVGKGDLLVYTPHLGRLVRAQAPYLSSREITRLSNALRKVQKVERVSFPPPVFEEESMVNVAFVDENAAPDKLLYEQILDFVKSRETVSISLIQRKFKIGFNRAARIVETLESDGIVTPPDRRHIRRVRK